MVRRVLKLLILITTAVLSCSLLYITAAAEKVSVGLSVTTENADHLTEASLERGQEFILNIKPPSDITEDVDSLYFRVDYDPDVVEFVDWVNILHNIPVDSLTLVDYQSKGVIDGKTFAAVGIPSGRINFPVGSDEEVRIKMRVKDGVRASYTDFELSTYILAVTNEADPHLTNHLWQGGRREADGNLVTNTKAKLKFLNLPIDTAIEGGGLTVNALEIGNDDTLTATVTVPAIGWDLEKGYITVKYKTDDFEFVRWDEEPGFGEKYSDAAAGEFGVRFDSIKNELDEQAVFSAVLKPKNTGTERTSEISLFKNTTCKGENGENIDLWTPSHSSWEVKITSLPFTGGGISVSKTAMNRGETVDVTVTVPPITREISRLSFKVSYSPEVFDVYSWSPVIPNAEVDHGYNELTQEFYLETKNSVFTLPNGCTLKAVLKAKDSAPTGDTDITLSSYNATVSGSDNAWQPDLPLTRTVKVGISYPIKTGGLTLSKSSISADASESDRYFNAVVDIPALNAAASGAQLTLGYDSSTFSVVTLPGAETGFTADAGTAGRIVFTPANGTGDITINAPVQLTIGMKLKDAPVIGQHTFTLAAVMNDNAGNVLWNPADAQKSKTLEVTSGGAEPDPQANTGGYIYIEPTEKKRGDTFTVQVQIPQINYGIDFANVSVEYDYNAFSVSFSPDLTGYSGFSSFNYDGGNGKGYFGISKNRSGNMVFMTAPLTLTAYVTVKDTAAFISYPFSFSANELSYRKTTGTDVQLWNPAVKSDYIKIVSGGSDISYVTGGSIRVSRSSITSGETVTVYYDLPRTALYADSASVKIKYDTSAFYVETMPTVAGFSHSDNGTGTITFALTEPSAYLGEQITLSAILRSIKTGSYSFALDANNSAITFTDKTKIWVPGTPSSASVYVEKSGGGGGKTYTGGKVTLSKTSVKRGGTFTATVEIPKMEAYAESLYFLVDFDGLAFDVTSWSPSVSGAYNVDPESGYGYFSLDLSNSNIDMKNGLKLKASMKAYSDADLDTYTFTLRDAAVIGRGYSETASRSLWFPTSVTDTIKVTSGSSIDPTPTPDPTPVPSGSYPVRGGGIDVSRNQVSAGDLITVYVTVPAIGTRAYSGSVGVRFDSNLFEVVTWSPNTPGIVPVYGSGSFSFMVSGSTGLDVTYSQTFSAVLRVKSYYYSRNNTITLSDYSLRNGTTELWMPTTTSAYVTIGSSGSRYPYYYPDDYRTYPNYPNPPVYIGTGVPSTAPTTAAPQTQISQPVITINNTIVIPDSIYPDNGRDTNGGNNNTWYEEEEPIIPDYDDYDVDVVPYADTTRPVSTNTQPRETNPPRTTAVTETTQTIRQTRKPEVSLMSILDGIDSKQVLIRTMPSFFSGDTIVYIRNTEEANTSARSALVMLDKPGLKAYAFDVSIYDTGTGRYIHKIPNKGYLDLELPVPNAFKGDEADIEVYHVEDGVPAKIDSIVIEANGVNKIHFRADSFSPYMFVDRAASSNTAVNDRNGQNGQTVNNNNNNGSNNTGNANNGYSPISGLITGKNDDADAQLMEGRNANPHTGSAGWIIIPSAAVVCVLLARGSKKRKRSSRR